MTQSTVRRALLLWVAAGGLSGVTGAHAGYGYRELKYKDTQALLKGMAEKYPANASLFTLATSDSGHEIQGLKVGSGPVKTMVVATHHGNEYGSTEVAKGFVRSMAEDPLPGQTVYIIPVLNISGYDRKGREESAHGRTYDPNRDYPGPCGTAGPFKLKSTSALAKFVEETGIVSSATLHTNFPAVVYPWGISSHDLSTPYDDLFVQLTKYATVESGYPVGNSTEVIYPADGTYEDYVFWRHGVWSLLFELGHTHNPDDAAVEKMVSVNVPGLRRFLAQAPSVRAEKHAFTGSCDARLRALDRHDE